MQIGQHTIAAGHTFIVAEIGVNHNGEINLAKEMISAARESGADAVKFQSFKAEWMCDPALLETKDVAGVTGGSKSSYEMYKALELSPEAHHEVFAWARKQGITCFASVFDSRTLPLLLELEVPALKIASPDLLHLPLIDQALATGLPVLLSTGLATEAEVFTVMQYFQDRQDQILLMQCVSEYPMDAAKANLRVIPEWRHRLGCPVGFSDHSLGTTLPVAAVALGACAVEKHFTLDTSLPGPDQKLSMDPGQMQAMVKAIRIVEEGLGRSTKEPTPAEWEGRHNGRRGIKAARNLPQGTCLTLQDLCLIKPATGLEPARLDAVIGRRLKTALRTGQPLEWQHLAPGQ